MSFDERTTLSDRPCRPRGILLVGINPSPISVQQGHYYQGRLGLRLWARLERIDFLRNSVKGREDDAFLAAGNGLTDLVKRATDSASELDTAEYIVGKVSLQAKILEWCPRLVLFHFRPPAEQLLGPKVRPGPCGDFEGVPCFLFTGPYASTADSERIDRKLILLLQQPFALPPKPRRPSIASNTTMSTSISSPEPQGQSDICVHEKTQRITEVDLSNHRIRLPKAAKRLFPSHRLSIQIELRGQMLDARYDPRTGPDRERSATLTFKKAMDSQIRPDEILIVEKAKSDVIRLY
jgi:TDG/mug DNA glycosylase family protein